MSEENDKHRICFLTRSTKKPCLSFHLLHCDNRIQSEGTNHQHFLRKNDDYSKTEKENKNRRHASQEKQSDKLLGKFQLNRFRGCRLGVKNVRLTFQNFRSEKTRKIYFLRHLNRNRIITPNHPVYQRGIILQQQ